MYVSVYCNVLSLLFYYFHFLYLFISSLSLLSVAVSLHFEMGYWLLSLIRTSIVTDSGANGVWEGGLEEMGKEKKNIKHVFFF